MERHVLGFSRPNSARIARQALLVGVTSLALVAGGMVASSAVAGTTDPSTSAPSPGVFKPVQPSAPRLAATSGPSAEATALTQAKETGKRVEVTAEDTSTSTEYANPNGTLTRVVSQGPVRVRDEQGDWVPVDMGLVPSTSSGRLSPQASPTVKSFSDTGSGVLASLSLPGSTSLGMGFADALDAPVVDGNTATYPFAGGDPEKLVVSALNTGFAAHVELASAPESAPTYTFPLTLNGLAASLNEENQLELRDDSGDLVAASSPLVMWDTQRDSGGDPMNVSPVAATLVTLPNGGTGLQLTPSMGFLTAASTQYPVTIDPDISSLTHFADTYVDSGDPNSTAGGLDTRIRVGVYQDANNNLQKWFGFEKFRIDPVVGKDVLSATLAMHQYYTDSCTARTTSFYPTARPSVYTNWTWNNRPPAVTDSVWSSSITGAHGAGGSCPESDVSIDVTRQVNGYTNGELDGDWSGDTPDKPYVATIELQPHLQSSVNEVRFCSFNLAPTGSCSDAANEPTLSLTYRPLLGTDTATSTFDHRLNDAATLHVNNDTGNAIGKSQDLHLAGVGQDLSVNRWYNSAANQTGGIGTTSLGTAGWSLSLGPDVYIEQMPGYPNRYDFHAPGGAVYGHFVRESTNPSDPDYNAFYEPKYGGVDATLKDEDPATGPEAFTLTMHASQFAYHFTQVDPGSGNLYLSSTEDRSGNTITYNYVPGSHQLSSVVDTAGRSLSVAYNAAGYVHTITDTFGPVNRTWTYDYDTSGHGTLVDYIDPTGAETDYDYTLIGGQYFLTTITDPEQSDHERPTTVLSYQSGQVTEVQYQTGTSGGAPVYATFTFNYSDTTGAQCNTGTRSTVVTDLSDTPSGATTYCFQDIADGTAAGRNQAQVIDGVGNRRSAQYSPDRKPVSLTSPEDDGVTNGSTVAGYGDGTTDPLDQLKSVTEPHDPSNSAAAANYYYKASSSIPGYKYLPTSVKDTNGNCTHYTYTTGGLVASASIGTQPPLGGDCSSTSFTSGDTWHNDYNTHGQVQDTWDANGANTAGDATRYSYNSDGQVAAVQRPGNTSSTPCTASSPQALCTSYTYDGDGRVATMTDGRGKTTSYSYDKDDRVTQVLYDGASSCSIASGNCLTYTYDGEGNLAARTDVSGTTTFGYDMLNQQTSQDLPDGSTVDTVYDAAGNLLEYDQGVNDGTGTVTDSEIYSHNAANQTITARNNNTVGSTDVVTLQPNKDGKPKQVTYPTTSGIGSVTTLYTTAGHLKSITPDGSGLPTYTYSWKQGTQETDELQSVTTSNGQASQDGTITYDYNLAEQLTSATDDSSQPDYGYTYDNAGNIQSKTVGGTSTYYGYTEAGILCWQGASNGTQVGQTCPTTPSGDTPVTHDDNGNNTGSSGAVNTYDPANRASSVAGVPQTYLDQGNNLRSADGTGTTAMTFVNGPLGLTARTAGGDVTFYIRNTDGSLLEERGAPGTRYYILGNHQSATGLIDTTGSVDASYLYGPYGETTTNPENGGTTAADNPFRWDGGYQDTIEGDNVYHFGARYYDPSSARWTQPDPNTGRIRNPATLEKFTYAQGDPVNGIDPSGLIDWTQTLIGAWDVADGLAWATFGVGIAIFTAPSGVGIAAGLIVAVGGLVYAATGVVDVWEGLDL
jgi:RHS repeat-associated protein